MSLSKENYDKLNTNCLYQNEPKVIARYTYHCKNWTFRVYKNDNGTAFMLDTYFDSWDRHKIEVTDENINDFIIVFDFKEVKNIEDRYRFDYEEEDIYRVATGIGGYYCGGTYWVKKDAVKSKRLLIMNKEKEIESLKRDLEWAENELKRLLGDAK